MIDQNIKLDLMDVSIIIVSWNVRDLLIKCISSICEQAEDIKVEIIVIDNASSDGTIKKIKEEFPQVRLIENMENVGFAAGCNQGIMASSARYCLMLNPDTTILDNTIYKTFLFAEKHRDAAVISCKVLNEDRTLQRSCAMYPSIINLFLSATYLYKFFPGNRFFGRERMTWWDYDDIREVESTSGCFMLVRKDAINEVGMMDEQFFMYAEEMDWCYRFSKKGWKIVFAPVGEIIHYRGKSSKQNEVKSKLQNRGSAILFVKKHRNRLTFILACFLVGLFFVLRVPFWAGIAVINRKRRTEALLNLKLYLLGTFGAWTGGKHLLSNKQKGNKPL